MAKITDALHSFQNMLDVEYEFVIGRKGKSVRLTVEFQKMHFFHLAGLQYLKDLPRLAFSAELIFDQLSVRKTKTESISASHSSLTTKKIMPSDRQNGQFY